MNFIIGYAGLPSEVVSQLTQKQKLNITGVNAEFVTQSLIAKEGVISYTKSHANFFTKEFATRLSCDHENLLKDTGFGLVYISYDQISTERFRNTFFPSLYAIEIEWNFDKSSKETIRQSISELLELMRVATNRLKDAIPIIKKEITEADGRTPLLLPVKNFESKWLVANLIEVQKTLIFERDKNNHLKKLINKFVNYHPRTQPTDHRYQRQCFVDRKNIEFNPPGQDRHGFPRAGFPHTDICFISGHRRLGAPYDHAFHYDCVRPGGNLKGDFWGCHSPKDKLEGKPHLNISPNDFVRC